MKYLTILLCLLTLTVNGKKKSNDTYEVFKGCTPLDEKVTDETSSKISCRLKKEVPVSNYYVWLPEGYNEQASEKRRYPFLTIDSPSGNAQKQLKRFKDWAASNKWILLMPVEVSNNNKHTMNHFHAMMVDASNRFKLSYNSGFFTGCSGGGRRSSIFAAHYKEHAAGVLHSAGITVSGKIPFTKSPVFSASVLGDRDANIHEMYHVSKAMKDRGYYKIIDMGHTWYPKEDGEEALDWLTYKIAERKKPKLHEPIVKEVVRAKFLKLKTLNKIQQNETIQRIAAIFKTHYNLRKDKDMLKIYNDSEAMRKGLLRDKEYLKELRPMQLFKKVYQKYCIEDFCKSLSWANYSLLKKNDKVKVASTTKKIREKINKEMNNIIKLHPNTIAASLAQKELKRIKKFEAHWKK